MGNFLQVEIDSIDRQSMASNSGFIGLSVFNDEQSPQSNCTDFKACIAIRRLSCALRYYSSLKVKTSTDDENIFTNFINEVYKYSSLIQDFYHLQQRCQESR